MTKEVAMGEEFTVRKIAAYRPISEELAMEYGLIPDTRPAPLAPTWRRRARWRFAAWVRPVRLVLAARIGGVSRETMEEVTWL